MWEFIDKVVYINLDKRSDRRERMEKLTECFGDKVIRFSAIEHSVGIIGCGMSHLAVLKMAQDSGWKNVLVLEDDIEWNKFEEGYATLEKLVQNPYDVIMLGGSSVEYSPETFRLAFCLCAHANLVNGDYFQTMINNLTEGLMYLNETMDIKRYAHDVHNHHIKIRDNWFIIVPSLVYQRPDYSDIEKKEVNYIRYFNL